MPGSSVRAGGTGDRIAMRARFSGSVQTGAGVHPTSYTTGTGSFPGLKRPGRGVDSPPPSRAEIEERAELYLYSPSGSSWSVLGGNLVVTQPQTAGHSQTSNLANCQKRYLTLRLLMSYIYIYIYIYIYMEHPFLMFLDHTQRRSTVGRTPLDE